MCPKSSPPQRLSSKTMTLPPTLSKNCLFDAWSRPSTDESDVDTESTSPFTDGRLGGRLCEDPRDEVIRGRANFPSVRSVGVGRGVARDELGSESVGSKNPRRVLGSTLERSPCVNATISASAPVGTVSVRHQLQDRDGRHVRSSMGPLISVGVPMPSSARCIAELTPDSGSSSILYPDISSMRSTALVSSESPHATRRTHHLTSRVYGPARLPLQSSPLRRVYSPSPTALHSTPCTPS